MDVWYAGFISPSEIVTLVIGVILIGFFVAVAINAAIKSYNDLDED
jgi:4-hydroxybenzoate polyprenyltransferase